MARKKTYPRDRIRQQVLTRDDIAEVIQRQFDLPRREARQALHYTVTALTAILATGHSVDIYGLGRLFIRWHSSNSRFARASAPGFNTFAFTAAPGIRNQVRHVLSDTGVEWRDFTPEEYQEFRKKGPQPPGFKTKVLKKKEPA